jgi:hypothetical protein
MLTTDVVLAWAVEGVDLDWMCVTRIFGNIYSLIAVRRLTVAVLASSHNVKALDPIDKVTVVTLKVRSGRCRPQCVHNDSLHLGRISLKLESS